MHSSLRVYLIVIITIQHTMSLTLSSKRVTLIRHGCTEANLWLSQAGSTWGCRGFKDDEKYRDSILSPKGIEQCRNLNDRLHSADPPIDLSSVSHLFVSPLTRTLQTATIVFDNTLVSNKLTACPLLRERHYLASDVGTPRIELRTKFPNVNFDKDLNFPSDERAPWWYTHDERKDGPYKEWRPHDKGQSYTEQGEVQTAFDRRMNALYKMLCETDGEHIACVTSWGVIRWLTDGRDFDNCDCVTLEINEIGKNVEKNNAKAVARVSKI